MRYWRLWFVAAGAAVVVLILAVDALWPQKADVSTRDLTLKEQRFLARELSPGLNDPGSIRWSWLPLNRKSFKKGKGLYCGYLDAKDSFGKYLGFQPFLAAVRVTSGNIDVASLALIGTDEQAAETVRRMCAEAGYDIP